MRLCRLPSLCSLLALAVARISNVSSAQDLVSDPGNVLQNTFHFSAPIVETYSGITVCPVPFSALLSTSRRTFVVRRADETVWLFGQNIGRRPAESRWKQLSPNDRFVSFLRHPYSSSRLYILTSTQRFWATTDSGYTFNPYEAPSPPNSFGVQPIHFHPDTDKLIWIGDRGCQDSDDGDEARCHTEASYTRDNGRHWTFMEDYVRNCRWGVVMHADSPRDEVWCESYLDKAGSQRYYTTAGVPLSLVIGRQYFTRKGVVLEANVRWTLGMPAPLWMKGIGLVGTKSGPNSNEVALQLWNGTEFKTAQFPSGMNLKEKAYTPLSWNGKSLFLDQDAAEMSLWSNVLKSEATGLRFTVSAQYVNNVATGLVDFESLFPGVWRANIIANPREATRSGEKRVKTAVSFDDGSTWTPISPPKVDSEGKPYPCAGSDLVNCSLHIHGYSPSRATEPPQSGIQCGEPGLLLAIGNVGAVLDLYDTGNIALFMSRDAGLSWTELRKLRVNTDTKVAVLNDGAILVLAESTSGSLLYSLDLGASWESVPLVEEGLRVRRLEVPPAYGGSSSLAWNVRVIGDKEGRVGDTVLLVDFGALAKYCTDDREYYDQWSPSNGDETGCLLGQHTNRLRRTRIPACLVRSITAVPGPQNCTCTLRDIECDLGFTHNANDVCDRIPGTTVPSAPPSGACASSKDSRWFEPMTRKIPLSSCVFDEDQGIEVPGNWHICPAVGDGQSGWIRPRLVAALVFGILLWMVAVSVWCYIRRRVRQGRTIQGNTRLGDTDDDQESSPLGDITETAETMTAPADTKKQWSASFLRRWFGAKRGGDIRLSGEESGLAH
ncbi:Sortilin [Mycena kentingensis (nom. inval.)]|nr:Sortilin [Mycena kentingensis (nom. inval.)]